MNSLDVSRPTHNLLIYMYIDVIELKLDVWAMPLNEYIKGVDAFINFAKKDMLDNIRGNLTNIEGMRRDIVQMMC
jgi:hypothetical protein